MATPVSIQTYVRFFFVLQLLDFVQLSETAQHLETPSDKVVAICRAICSQSLRRPKVTFVFKLRVMEGQKHSFDHLWSLPNSLLYLSDQYPALGRENRLIEISWEENNPVFGERSYDETCLFNECRYSEKNLQQFHLERRVLIQVRSLPEAESQRAPQPIGLELLNETLWDFQLLTYRSIFFVVLVQRKNVVHSSYIVAPTDVPDGQVRFVTVESLNMERAGKVFDPRKHVSNFSLQIALQPFQIYFRIPPVSPYRYVMVRAERCSPVSISR